VSYRSSIRRTSTKVDQVQRHWSTMLLRAQKEPRQLINSFRRSLEGFQDIQQVTKEAFKHRERQRVCSTISQALNLPPKLQDHETIHAIKTAESTDWQGRSCVWSQVLQGMSQIVSWLYS
jgi:hypothetical protein